MKSAPNAACLPVYGEVCIITGLLDVSYLANLSMVAVAQLVESRIVIPVVVGSSPIGHPKIPSAIKRLRQSRNFMRQNSKFSNGIIFAQCFTPAGNEF